MKLGLIDGIGNAEQILREKFGEDIVIKKTREAKSFLAKKLSSSLDNQIDNISKRYRRKSPVAKIWFINAKKN